MAASASDAHPQPIYNARFRLVVPLLDADGDLVSPSSPDSEVSQDQGTFADCTNEATEIATSSGMVYLDLTAGEMDTKCSTVIIKSTGAKTTPIVLYPVRLPVIRTGTAQAGAASTITLDSGASAINDYYTGCYVNITNNSPSNAQGQARRIVGYVGSTKVATVEGTYGTNPSSASTFEVLATAEWVQRLGDINAISGAAVSTSTAQLGVNAVNLGGTAQTGRDIGASVLLSSGTGTGQVSLSSGTVTLTDGSLTAAKIGADAITAAKVAADVTTELQAGLATAASIAALNNLSAAQVNAEVDTALADYDAPTNAEMVARTLAAASYATAANQTTILNRLGAWTGSARNTILGAIQALFRKDSDASVPSDVNADLGSGAGAADNTTDSLQAIRDRGDAAWDTADVSALALEATAQTILTDTNELQTDWANGGRLDNILDARASQASVDTIDGIVDTLLVTSNKLDDTLEDDGGTFRFTANALEEAPTGGSAPSAAEIADAVWDEAVAGHVSAGSTGERVERLDLLASGGSGGLTNARAVNLDNLDAAVSTRATPAQVNTEADTALADVGLTTTITGRIDAAISTRASQASVDTVDDFLDTEISAIKAKTDNLPASPAAVGSAMTLTSGERDAIAAALLDLANGIETSVTVRQALRAIAGTLAGQIADAATGTNTFKAIGNPGTTRVTSTVDEDGNRTGVTLNL